MPTLDFKGKSVIYSHHLGVPFLDLKIDEKKSLPPKDKKGKKQKPSLDDNLIIHGDNLHALKALLPRYAGKIKCIYIDPPYNTGNEGWQYNDNVKSPMIKEWLSKKVGLDDLERHDKWLCMMWPRLQLLKELLSDDGVIFVSIDDNEANNLRLVMNEIFGDENFITNFIWNKKSGRQNDAKFVSVNHEYILSYAKNIGLCEIYSLERTEENNQEFKNLDNDPRGDWIHRPLHAKSGNSPRYIMTFPNGIKWQAPNGTYPRHSKEKLLEMYKENRIWFGTTGGNVPRRKKFKSEVKEGIISNSLLMAAEVGNTQKATQSYQEIMKNINFDNPKPITLIEYLTKLVSEKNTIILDSFAGSGTTAHAVLDLNKEDGGNRKFILVECEEYADKITAERTRRVIKGVSKAKDENLKNGLGGSFTYCTLGSEISEENLLKGKSLPSYEALSKYVFYTATGKTLRKFTPNDKFYITKLSGDTAFFVIYEPNKKFLASNDSALSLERKEIIQKIMKQKKCSKAIVFASACFYSLKELSQERITFCQLPFAIHRILG